MRSAPLVSPLGGRVGGKTGGRGDRAGVQAHRQFFQSNVLRSLQGQWLVQLLGAAGVGVGGQQQRYHGRAWHTWHCGPCMRRVAAAPGWRCCVAEEGEGEKEGRGEGRIAQHSVGPPLVPAVQEARCASASAWWCSPRRAVEQHTCPVGCRLWTDGCWSTTCRWSCMLVRGGV